MSLRSLGGRVGGATEVRRIPEPSSGTYGDSSAKLVLDGLDDMIASIRKAYGNLAAPDGHAPTLQSGFARKLSYKGFHFRPTRGPDGRV
jgi:hypothetical protein